MQTCRFNYNNIIPWNNYTNNILNTQMNKYKFKNILERHMRTQLGLRKPDVLAYINDICYRYSYVNRYHRYYTKY